MPEAHDAESVIQALSQLGWALVRQNEETLVFQFEAKPSFIVVPCENGRVRRETMEFQLRYELVDTDAFWALME